MTTETTDMNTENITSIITAETGLTITPPVRKRKIIKKAAEPSMKEATELAEGKTLVIKEQKEEEYKPPAAEFDDGFNKALAELRADCYKWKKLYEELKEKTDPLLAKLEEQRQKRNEASKKSKKASREKDKKVKTELEERVKKLEEKVLEKDFREVLDNPKPSSHCENCGETFGESDNDGEGYKNEGDVAGCRWCESCWMEHKCADCSNHEDDITDENPLCAECRESAEKVDMLFNTRHRVPTYCKKYEEEEKSEEE